MKYLITFTAVALVLAATAGAPALAADEGKPTPSVMTDVAPLPPQDRASVGAVILADEPVIAQREAYTLAAARYEGLFGRDGKRLTLRVQELASQPDTRVMGGSPAPKK